jgi:hypothetical protein
MENRQLIINWYCLMIPEEREKNGIFKNVTNKFMICIVTDRE